MYLVCENMTRYLENLIAAFSMSVSMLCALNMHVRAVSESQSKLCYHLPSSYLKQKWMDISLSSI